MIFRGYGETAHLYDLLCGRPRTSRMLNKPTSRDLISFRPSTGTRPPHHSAARTDLVLLIRRTVRPRGYASGFDSPAALPDELFEHPAGCARVVPDAQTNEIPACAESFSPTC